MLESCLLDELVTLLAEAGKIREVDLSDGTRAKHGSNKHVKDLGRRISELETWRNKQKRGSEARANYSRLISRLKGELASAKRQAAKKA